MKETILITGHNGSLAKEAKKLLATNYSIRTLTTKKHNVDNHKTFYWNIDKKYIDKKALENCDHIVHLAGYSILKNWNNSNKKKMYDSRVKSAKLLFDTCSNYKINPKTFICASAMGIYGLDSTGEKNEESNPGSDWVSKMAIDWEAAADEFKHINSRVVKMRISLLMSKNSGFLKYNLLSIKLGIAGIIGNKNNPINWIHINDAALFIKESIEKKQYTGAYNLSVPNDYSQIEFITEIKKHVCRYAIIINVPLWVIRTIIGDRSQIVNNQMKLNVNKLKKTGFNWQYKSPEKIFKKN